jgi:hypothetical protein
MILAMETSPISTSLRGMLRAIQLNNVATGSWLVAIQFCVTTGTNVLIHIGADEMNERDNKSFN